MTDCSKNNFNLKLKNFQAILKAELEFVQGINLICGESNSGKSAILRAVRNVVLNPKKPQRFINYSAKDLSVCVNYLDNLIQWDVTQKAMKYKVNGEDFIKLGGSNLSKILDNSGFVVDNNKLMNLEGEMELPFPFGMSSSDLFKLFEKSIICASDSSVILKAMKDNESFANKEKENVTYEKDKLESKLQAVLDLEAEVDLKKLNKFRSELKEVSFRLNKMLEDYKLLGEGYKANEELKKCMKAPEINFDLTSYVKLRQDVSKLSLMLLQCKALAVNKIVKEVDSFDLQTLIDLKKAYATLLSNAKVLQANAKALKEFKPVDFTLLEGYEGLVKDFNKLSKLKNDCIALSSKLKNAKEKVKAYKAQLDNYKVCPLCGQEIK